MDIYSKPVKVEKYKFGTLFYMKPRTSKPGRELVINYDKRLPFVEDFEARYSYYVRFLEPGNAAGNHYHNEKRELMIPLTGKFTIYLEDIKTKEQEKLVIKPEDHVIFYVSAGISHKVISEEDSGVLLVMATSPSTDGDECHYEIKYK